MTGFGVGRATVGAEEISVELRSVNHKYCEVKPRLPRELAPFEPALVKAVKEKVVRGAVDLVARRERAASSSISVPVVDTALAREYHRAFRELGHAVGSSEPAPLSLIAQQPGVVRLEERAVDPNDAQRALDSALGQALDALVVMRLAEGASIAADLLARLGKVEETVGELVALAPRAVEEYRARLSERIAELTRDVAIDPQRLVQEVAIFAERTDVAEEMTRLRSHLAQFRALLATAEPSGRRMDFIVQEMHREVNTTGSKSQHPEISTRVVALKAELERIREQVQNVE
ncbi:MAG TPA: YicC/YloC family endoribonuclease [Myxococcaceae bacterium]|nr:YicC/YloC family endoribonuclease [Myxococcaceae bacterium]